MLLIIGGHVHFTKGNKTEIIWNNDSEQKLYFPYEKPAFPLTVTYFSGHCWIQFSYSIDNIDLWTSGIIIVSSWMSSG